MFFLNDVSTAVVSVILTLLVIGVTIQFIKQDEVASRRLEELEQAFLGPAEDPGQVVEVADKDTGRQGHLVIDIDQELSLTEVWLVRNGEKVSSFRGGRAVLNVAPGDRIHLDASAYKGRLKFEISDASLLPSGLEVGDVVRTEGNRIFLGAVEERQKL
ncbi:MAG: hypothetical protein ACOCZM_02005 [Bacillota bacterium]